MSIGTGERPSGPSPGIGCLAWFYFIVSAPMTLLRLINTVQMLGVRISGYGSLLLYARQSLMAGPVFFSLALVFVPWLIIRHRESFSGAFMRNFRILAGRWRDLGILALRWVVIVAPIWAVLDYYSTTGELDRLILNTAFVAFQPLRLILLVAVVILFLHARGSLKDTETAQNAGGSTAEESAP